MRKNPRFPPSTKLLAVLIVILAVLGTVLIKGGAMFSPGPLYNQPGQTSLGGVLAHGELSNRCDSCHAAPWSRDTMSDRCLMCHSDVAKQLTIVQELHGMFVATGGPLKCTNCHTEHQGPMASLTPEGLQRGDSFSTVEVPLIEIPLPGSEADRQTLRQDGTPGQAPTTPAFIWTAIGIGVALIIGLIIFIIVLLSKAPRLATLTLVPVVTALWLSFSGIMIAQNTSLVVGLDTIKGDLITGNIIENQSSINLMPPSKSQPESPSLPEAQPEPVSAPVLNAAELFSARCAPCHGAN